MARRSADLRRLLHFDPLPKAPFPSFLRSRFHLYLRTKAARRHPDDAPDDRHRRNDAGGGGEPWDRSFRLDKRRGQHLLTNPRVLDTIARVAGLRPSDTVLEIGPGTGNLTARLLQSARRVVAVEIDPRMVDSVLARASRLGVDDRLTVITGDALKTEFPDFDICVANIPYGISSPLIAKLLFSTSRPSSFRSAVLLLQKEFARRLLTVPGDSEFNRLAANVRQVATVELLMDVSKKDFVPCPKVDSTLVRLQPRTDVPEVDLDEWLAFTRTCFNKKNKTLGAIFKQKKRIAELLGRSKSEGRSTKVFMEEEQNDNGAEEIDDDNHDDDLLVQNASEVSSFKDKVVGILKSGGFEGKRPSKLSNEELLHLLQLFNQNGVQFR
ncbi:rADc [Musa troglodytarum]|uniref:rRNA adenine N(6)-methyltransferase n=1 Tax=Musa troglodytarum TaxID=320322 RepID=A0A9E7HAK5_9LILI|nr:rADc [Musa troglodytarum]